MPRYTVQISRKAQKQLDNITDHQAKPILAAISKLADNPHPPGHIKLKNREGYRIRVGNYRIIYTIINEQLVVDVIAIGDRKDIYR